MWHNANLTKTKLNIVFGEGAYCKGGDSVNCCIVHPIQPTLVVAGYFDGSIVIWDIVKQVKIKQWIAHEYAVSYLAFTKDGTKLISGSVSAFNYPQKDFYEMVYDMILMDKAPFHRLMDTRLKIWDVASGTVLTTLFGHAETISCIIIQGERVISGSWDKTLRVWDIATGTCLKILSGHTENVSCVAISGTQIVSGSWDTTLRVWDIDTGTCLKVLAGHHRPITYVAISGDKIVSGSSKQSSRVWSLTTGQCEQQLKGIIIRVMNGYAILRSSEVIGAWNLQAARYEPWIPNIRGEYIAAVSDKPNWIVIGGGTNNKDLYVLDLEAGKCIQSLKGHTLDISCIVVTSNRAISGSLDTTLRIWDLSVNKVLQKHYISCFSAIMLDNEIVLHGLQNDFKVLDVYGRCSRIVKADASASDTKQSQIIRIAVDGSTVAYSMWNPGNIEICVLRFLKEECLQVFKYTGSSTLGVDRLALKNNQLVTWKEPDDYYSRNSKLNLWNLKTSECKLITPEISKTISSDDLEIITRLNVTSMAIDEHHVILGAESSRAYMTSQKNCGPFLFVVDLLSAQYKRVMGWHVIREEGENKDVINCVALKDNNVISGSSDSTVRLWDIITGDCLKTFDMAKPGEMPLAVSFHSGNPDWIVVMYKSGLLTVRAISTGYFVAHQRWPECTAVTLDITQGRLLLQTENAVIYADIPSTNYWDTKLAPLPPWQIRWINGRMPLNVRNMLIQDAQIYDESTCKLLEQRGAVREP
jgi:WD40 repeat protein